MNANDNGIHIQGANNVVENCVVHDNDDTGIQIGINTSAPAGTSGINNTVKELRLVPQLRRVNGGENADGFGAKEASGTNNKFIGCRAWENADDGYDFFAWTGPVRLRTAGHRATRAMRPSPARTPTATGSSWAATTRAATTSSMNCSSWDNKTRGYTNNSGANSSCTRLHLLQQRTGRPGRLRHHQRRLPDRARDDRPQHGRHDPVATAPARGAGRQEAAGAAATRRRAVRDRCLNSRLAPRMPMPS